jgi:hypothetical protein
MLRLALLITALLAFAAPAQAAESFLGVLSDGKLVRFSDEAPTALSTPKAVSGLKRGDRIVALAPGYALGRSGTLYILNSKLGRVTPSVAEVRLTGRSWTLAVLPDNRHVRVFSDTGEETVIDTANFSISPGPGIKLQDGTPVKLAATAMNDGRIVGVDPARGTLVSETAPGSGAATELPLRNTREVKLQFATPLSFAGAAGRGYILSGLPGTKLHPQSRLVKVDLATGRTTGESGPYFFRQLVSFAPLGSTPPDTEPPRIRFLDVPKTVSLRDLAKPYKVRFSVSCSEACQVLGGSAVGGRSNIVTVASRDTPGPLTLLLPRANAKELRLMRFRLGKTIKLRAFVRDWVGNSRIYDRDVRLVR